MLGFGFGFWFGFNLSPWTDERLSKCSKRENSLTAKWKNSMHPAENANWLPGLGLIHISEPPASQPASQRATGSRFCLGSWLRFPNLILDCHGCWPEWKSSRCTFVQLDFAITSAVQVRIAKINVSPAWVSTMMWAGDGDDSARYP